MASPSLGPFTGKREQYGKQPRRQRNSVAPAPVARFGRRATGHNVPDSSPSLRKRTSETTPSEYLLDPAGGTPCLWMEEPKIVFVIKKYRDRHITGIFKEICRFLVEEKDLDVMVERDVLLEMDVRNDLLFAETKERLRPWSCEEFDCDDKLEQVDFVVSLGGDGTLLHISSLFQQSVPPILPFRLGSLGFLTSLDVKDYRSIIENVLSACMVDTPPPHLVPGGDAQASPGYHSWETPEWARSASLTLRSRLECSIVPAKSPVASPMGISPLINGGPTGHVARFSSSLEPYGPGSAPSSPASLDSAKWSLRDDAEPLSPLPRPGPTQAQMFCAKGRSSSVITRNTQTPHMLVLNEVVIDRGQSAFLSNLEILCNGRPITDVQGDGLIVATPTGSTAYAAAAGASMVHPSVQAMVVTPICPHSLSFRPIMVPGGVNIEVRVPIGGRGAGAVSCDGKNRQELSQGDSVHITMSIYPLPCVDGIDPIADWFTSLSTCLHWNARAKQKHFDAIEPPDGGEDSEAGEASGAGETPDLDNSNQHTVV